MFYSIIYLTERLIKPGHNCPSFDTFRLPWLKFSPNRDLVKENFLAKTVIFFEMKQAYSLKTSVELVYFSHNKLKLFIDYRYHNHLIQVTSTFILIGIDRNTD